MHRPASRPSRRTTAAAHLTVAVSPVHRVHHRRSAGTAVAVGVAALLAAAGPSAAAQATPDEARPATTQRVSVSHTGLQAADSSYGHSISADGRYVVFGSNDSTLVPGDTNDIGDLFVRDLQAGTTTRINVSSTGAQSDANAGNGAISGDGRYVAFASSDSHLVPGDTNNVADVFVRDLRAGTITRASVSSSGGQGSADSLVPVITADGRYVAFSSYAPNLVPNDSNGERLDAFVRDMRTGTTSMVSVSDAGAGGDHETGAAAISADGRYVTLVSEASNLAPGDTNHTYDVLLRDRTAGTTRLVSVSSTGARANGGSSNAAMTPNGRYVVFMSHATNLTPGDTNQATDIFVRDLKTGTTRLMSTSVGRSANGDSQQPVISNDGRYVAFTSHASNLTPGDTNNATDIYLRDRLTSATTRISIGGRGVETNGWSAGPAISADGRYIAYTSLASNLIPGDTNDTYDVFVRDRGAAADLR
ncbi:PD40 domain-containing protein [Actinoplanes sp. ATCC 53533]|uniref:PD40 domain-containing protein n=1 Tax=Actinoplanes sp. ATCC 53533 TaxID=1288362 RepID=UPI0013152A0D|nr:PD40 domain-containing protein [Actinoplanes sp. ATCC 53533]